VAGIENRRKFNIADPRGSGMGRRGFAKLAAVLLAALLLFAACESGGGRAGGGGEASGGFADQILMSIAEGSGADVYDTRVVVWRTPGNVRESSLYLLAGERDGDDPAWESAEEIPGARAPAAELPDAYGEYNRFEAVIRDLPPGVHTYRIGTAGTGTAGKPVVFAVRSAEEAEDRSVFLYFGDTQPNASIAEYADFGALARMAAAASPDADFALQCGDIGNVGDAPTEWSAFLSAAEQVFGGLPLMTAPGNHEVSPYVNEPGRKPEYYLDVFALPRNGPEGFEEEYYSIDYGNAHILSLSSNYLNPAETYSDDAEEAERIAKTVDQWIEEDLAGTDRVWKIVLMHQPAYPVAGDSTTAGMRERWIPIFDRTGVDLVLCGHQHEFMRTWPLRAGEESEDGLVQVMGNASPKNYETSETTLPFVAFEMGGVSGYHRVTATAGELLVEAFDLTGRQIDYWAKPAA
jgi:hypothetical protein